MRCWGWGGSAIVIGALIFGYQRADDPALLDIFVASGALAVFALLGLVVWVWLLFDENVAKPLVGLAGEIRARSHAALETAIDHRKAQYLGDIAPAASAIAETLSEAQSRVHDALRQHTAAIEADRNRLDTVLRALPVGVILCDEDHRVIFYNTPAKAMLADAPTFGIGRSICDCLMSDRLAEVLDAGHDHDICLSCQPAADRGLPAPEIEVAIRLCTPQAGPAPQPANGHLLMLTQSAATGLAAGLGEAPCTYDFTLPKGSGAIRDETPLSDLLFAVFDTETTGLRPDQGDEIVQIAATRVLNARVLRDETFDMLVDPERPIPAASTAIHGISAEMIAGAPTIAVAGARFHRFCTDSVLVAHNAPFDMAFLHRHAPRIGRRFDHPVLDTVLISAVVFGPQATHTLDAIADRLDVTIPDAVRHTALGDAIATAEVLARMLPVLTRMGLTTLGDLTREAQKHARILR